MLSKVKIQGNGNLSPVGAGARGEGEGWLTSACAPSRECIHISEREREIYFIRARIPLALEGLKLLQFFEHVPDFRSLLCTMSIKNNDNNNLY